MLSLLHGPTRTSEHDYWENHRLDYMDFCWQSNVSVFNTLPRLVITFLPKSKYLFISWRQSPFAVILEPPPKNKVCHYLIVSPSIGHEVMGLDSMTLVF